MKLPCHRCDQKGFCKRNLRTHWNTVHELISCWKGLEYDYESFIWNSYSLQIFNIGLNASWAKKCPYEINQDGQCTMKMEVWCILSRGFVNFWAALTGSLVATVSMLVATFHCCSDKNTPGWLNKFLQKFWQSGLKYFRFKDLCKFSPSVCPLRQMF